MTNKQRINLIKLTQGTEDHTQEVEDGIKTMAHHVRGIYEAFLKEGFNDEQAMFLTTNFMEAMILGGCDD